MEQPSGKPFIAAMNRNPVAIIAAVVHFKGITLL